MKVNLKYYKNENYKKKNSTKEKVSIIGTIILLVLATIILITTHYYHVNFVEQSVESLLFNLFGDNEGANLDILWEGIVQSVLPAIIIFLCLYLPTCEKTKNKFILSIQGKNTTKNIQIFPFKLISKYKLIYAIVLFILSFCYAANNFKLIDYLVYQNKTSMIFEEEYVSSKDIKLTFPNKKRNLIFIFLESMESSLCSLETGGGYSFSLMPELEKLAENNINFSNNSKIGGAVSTYGTTWTTAGILAQTSGTPLKIGSVKNSYVGYQFLPGVYGLGDILEDEGYNQEFMLGSNANYGGLRDYFQNHGNYKIFDVESAIKEGKMTKDEKVWWGFSDDKLYEWSKEEITNLASQGKPFSYVMITADTHFVDGYLSPNASKKYPQKYENVHAYASKIVNDFVDWLKIQDFYENTTIVIVGDHLGMQSLFYQQNLPVNFTRTVFNTFINSSVKSDNIKNRNFSTMDIFPTVLASMGVSIENDRLGLGTNLFSDRKTLIEEIGLNNFNRELAKKSIYYNEKLLQDDYQQKLKRKKNDKK